jgi:hypothetical protein
MDVRTGAARWYYAGSLLIYHATACGTVLSHFLFEAFCGILFLHT